MRAIHGGKSKNDRIDSEKIARLLRGGTFALGYVYPAQMRSTRDLLRRRTFLMKGKALSLLAAKLDRAVYWMLRRREVFDWTAPLHDFSPPCPVPVGKGLETTADAACITHPHRALCRWERVWKLRQTRLASHIPTGTGHGGLLFIGASCCSRQTHNHRLRARWGQAAT